MPDTKSSLQLPNVPSDVKVLHTLQAASLETESCPAPWPASQGMAGKPVPSTGLAPVSLVLVSQCSNQIGEAI